MLGFWGVFRLSQTIDLAEHELWKALDDSLTVVGPGRYRPAGYAGEAQGPDHVVLRPGAADALARPAADGPEAHAHARGQGRALGAQLG